MSKTLIPYIALVIIAVIVPVTACSHEGLLAKSGQKQAAKAKVPVETITIKRDMEIPRCEEREIDGYVLFIYSRYCPHCKEAMPIVEELVTKKKIGSRYLPVDTTTQEGRDVLKQIGIRVQFVPTLIKDCKAHVGAKKREYYEEVITGKKR